MASLTPNSTSLMNSHMYDFVDLRKCVKGPTTYCKGSLMDLINCNPDFSRFAYIVKLARLDKVFNDIQANFTVFVPSNRSIANISEGVFTNLDISSARQIVLASTLKYRMTSCILKDSPSSYFVTMNPVESLFITNINNITYISNCISIICYDIEATNGIIHVTDQMIWPYFT
jgi:uncharacterized surface protein with fasciclin (FAS1) repeats